MATVDLMVMFYVCSQLSSFYPVTFSAQDKFTVRDAGARRDLGIFTVAFTAEVSSHDARIFRLTPLP